MKKTVLFDRHEKLNAKIVDFAGFLMPVSYSSVNEEHLHVRNNVGVFDVSHMGEIEISGSNSFNLVQYLCSNDISKLKIGKAQYNCLTNDKGGIIDDLIVYRVESEKYLLIVNASNILKDWEWINKQNIKFNSLIVNLSDKLSLLAVQGPKAQALCQKFTSEDLSLLPNYSFIISSFAGIENIIISKTGYTGSGGFELYIPNKNAIDIWDALFNCKGFDLKPIGLAARDTLRIEMGYCLYGNDIDEETSPEEANLRWITKVDTSFIGHEIIDKQIKKGSKRKLIGFKLIEKSIPRSGYEVFDINSKLIGKVTSGTFSPVLKKGIGLAYLDSVNIKDDLIYIKIRNNLSKAEIVKTPFI
ncbi:MAG: glycine cleavage system protein T [Cryomorphaceae bacterium MED-G11]|jgi:aminomethyltransferase|nr:MAG: glycine cleavage system protein T [Cryomorphaceae bacterium MED-G11]|tara:strand:- start:4046 stop:5119 length:1074 start_codon:yes stop_codon:yes gene_type:complete